jgi:uncharacterized protein (DUF58 family)
MPTLRGWGVGLCGVLALIASVWFGRIDLLFAGLLLTLAPLAAMIAVAFDRPWLSVRRSFSPDSISVDELTQVRLEVRNLAARPTPGLDWVDTLPGELASAPVHSFPSLAGATGPTNGGYRRGADTVTLRYSTRARRRGAFLIGPLRVVRNDPFGLARCGYLVGESKMLLVTPRVTPLERGGTDEARGEGTDPELVRHSIPSADEVIPREYRPGDALRRVQWRATARQDRLMVRQEEQLSNPEAWILLDTVHEHGGDADAFERAVELVASVATHLLDLGYLVGVHETGERQLSGSYELPGGDQLLIAQLAGVERTREQRGDWAARLSVSLRAGSAASPTFLVLVDGDASVWRELAPLCRFADPAVAFLMTHTARGARETLEAAGWDCVDVDETTDASAAWASAMTVHRQNKTARMMGARNV